MTVVAVYARKSNDQAGVADDQKSVTRQVEHARDYATRKGWMVSDEHVYVDDGVSGAEFSNRPGFMRLMSALKPKAAFQVLVMSEESRLGREAIETAYALKQIVTAGVRVFFYLQDQERTLDSAAEKMMFSVQAFADEVERDKARLRVSDAMRRKAGAGHACGPAPFGYRNVPVLDPSGNRSHVERTIDDAEAAVVRRIFEFSAEGAGYTRIAKELNKQHLPCPRPKQGRPTSWAPSSVKEILDRRAYLGEWTWNRTKKCDIWGQRRQSDRPESEWIRKSVPTLRIVSDDQWQAAHGRIDILRRSAASGLRTVGRRRDIDSAYLLSGFARCAACGGSLGVMSGSHSSARGHMYGCLAYLKRGTSVCRNGLRVPLGRVNHAVLTALAGDVLRPAVVMAILDGVFRELASSSNETNLARNREEQRKIERQMKNLAQAIAEAGELRPVLDQLHRARAKQAELEAEAALLDRLDLGDLDRHAVEARIRSRLDDWRTVLASDDVQQGRRFLREALAGPLRFTPDGRTYRFEGETSFGAMFAGIAELAPFVVAVRGFEPRFHG